MSGIGLAVSAFFAIAAAQRKLCGAPRLPNFLDKRQWAFLANHSHIRATAYHFIWLLALIGCRRLCLDVWQRSGTCRWRAVWPDRCPVTLPWEADLSTDGIEEINNRFRFQQDNKPELSVVEALRLMRAFTRIKQPSDRRAVIDLVERLGSEG
jgi:hypothetical protein